MIYIQLLESMSLIALAAYIYNQFIIAKKVFYKNFDSSNHKLRLIFFFTIFSILGTYTGIHINSMLPLNANINIQSYALANTRPIGVITAGYIGGPLVGITVGILAGLHRLSMGGFTAVACSIATVIGGLCGGVSYKLNKKNTLNSKIGFITAIIAEIFEMILILLLSSPLEDAIELEKIIALPMIIINSLGVIIFINITKNAFEQYTRIGAIQAQKALIIAENTLSHFKKGLDKESAQNISKIIYDNNNFKTVFVTDTKNILCYAGDTISTIELKSSLNDYYKTPDYKVISYKNEKFKKENLFFCIPIFDNTNLEMIVGLKIKSKLYIDDYFILFAKQLGSLLSTQMEIYKLNKIAHEAYVAEYKALRSQIHPHFLFNALNTISSFCRTNPLKARELIINLSNYFRQTLKREEDFVTIKEEFEFLNSYIAIENARFGDRLKINISVPKELLNYKIPVFILQPIVENCIKHGILPKPSGGIVTITVDFKKDNLLFCIEDNGVGFDTNSKKNHYNNSCGIGLKNINERLRLLYGENHLLQIKSILNKGTLVSFSIPKEAKL